MSRRLDYTQIAPVGVKAGHLSLISQPDTIAALRGFRILTQLRHWLPSLMGDRLQNRSDTPD